VGSADYLTASHRGGIATHLRSQALAAFLPSYDIIVVHLRSQALAAHLPSYLYSGILYGGIDGHSFALSGAYTLNPLT
jgi:hypothetical protein